MNAAIELHDSELAAVVCAQDSVIIRLAPAYVHRSAGRPGIDPGTGWFQPVELLFAGGVVEGQLPEMPCTLDDGNVSEGGKLEGLIPLPLTLITPVAFQAHTIHGELVVIYGVSLEVKPVGEASYVEEFPGILLPNQEA